MLVLAILSLVLASISSTLARPAPVPATVLAARGPPAVGPRKTRSYGYQPIRWLTRFGGEVVADGSIDLEWTGGSGQGYEVYFIPQWPELEQYYPVDIVSTTDTSYKWRAPKIDEYPQGTTFILAVNDVVSGIGSAWYDVTQLQDFVEDKEFEDQEAGSLFGFFHL
ncbi:hypothetical protein EHS25_002386 [Saitozyma podzolica]|uniref:Uncharacterized protein n=1 Tax=Saitozyma podzolica TaxID=1890683 RepID=A0A427YE88_9TREE|nr:hypothetical protein EHS25_002386 [Saitozyma podzolica]